MADTQVDAAAHVARAKALPTVWRYHLPNVNHEGWAIAFLDSIGCFTVLSDYGDYGYRWPEAGWGPGDFRAFFVRCDGDYVLRKIARRDHYDGDATLRSVKERICEWRRHGNMKRETAREEFDLLERYERLRTREDFSVWYQHTRLDEAYEHAVYTHDPQAQGFVRLCLPRLRSAILEQLAAEAA